MCTGTIRLGPKTANHATWLLKHGYEVKETEESLSVQGKGEILTSLDLRTNSLEVMRGVISRGDLLSYRTKVQTEKGELSSIMLCSFLGPASALVVKTAKDVKVSNIFRNL